MPPLAAANDSSGEHILLFAHETRVAGRVDSFWHITRRVTSEAGLQTNSQLRIGFDPSFQRLVFHYVGLQRGGTRISELDARAIKFVQREPGLEDQIFDSRQTAVIFLEDHQRELVSPRVELSIPALELQLLDGAKSAERAAARHGGAGAGEQAGARADATQCPLSADVTEAGLGGVNWLVALLALLALLVLGLSSVRHRPPASLGSAI